MIKKPATILAFDTATACLSVALCVDEKKYTRFQLAPRQHATLLLPMIQALLDEARITLDALDVIAVGVGPGSFMGVRLAIGVAQGLSFGLQIPAIPISTLQILAQTAYEKTQSLHIAAAWDARMDELYWNFFSVDAHDVMQSQHADRLSAPGEIDDAVFVVVPFTLAGNAWEIYQKRLPAVLSEQNTQNTFYPEASNMLKIAQLKFLAGEVVTAEKLHPHYVRHHVVRNH